MGHRSEQLNAWFETPLGQRVLRAEMRVVEQILPHLFGFHLLQIGSIGHGQLLGSSRIMHRCILSQHIGAFESPYAHIGGQAEQLPFASDSLDVVILPHILEFEDHPHEVLRETQRVLIAEGHVVILGFNPVSSWGIWRWFLSKHEEAPWCGKFLRLLRIKDWLELLGFEVCIQKSLFFYPPFRSRRLLRSTRFLEHMGQRWKWQTGAVYLIVAKKRVTTFTPIKPKWEADKKAALIPSGPVIGSHLEGQHEQQRHSRQTR